MTCYKSIPGYFVIHPVYCKVTTLALTCALAETPDKSGEKDPKGRQEGQRKREYFNCGGRMVGSGELDNAPPDQERDYPNHTRKNAGGSIAGYQVEVIGEPVAEYLYSLRNRKGGIQRWVARGFGPYFAGNTCLILLCLVYVVRRKSRRYVCSLGGTCSSCVHIDCSRRSGH